MFENENHLRKIKELAENIVLTEAILVRMEKEVAANKEALIALMQQSGQTSTKLESGLSARLEVQPRISKRKEITSEQLFEWLDANGMADIIKPTVHPGTLQSTLEGHLAQGNKLPEELFHQFDQTVVRFSGKTQFLQSLKH